MTSITTLFFALFTLFSLVAARPRDVFVPPVLYPNNSTVWKVGSHHNVTWDISNAPKQITNTNGMVILSKDGILDIDHPLAKEFNILDARVPITVPLVPAGNTYAIVVFGDSGNSSPNFVITQ